MYSGRSRGGREDPYFRGAYNQWNGAPRTAEALLEGEAEKLTRKAIEMALDGDAIALKLCLDRICPPRKDRPVSFALQPINTLRDAADVMSHVLTAVASGEIKPADASEISKLIAVAVKAFEAAEVRDEKDWVERLTDAELRRIAAGGTPPRFLTIRPR